MGKELKVAALKNGTVIDHIPADKLFKVVSILHLDTCKDRFKRTYKNIGTGIG